MNLYKTSQRACTNAYNQGKEDAYSEILKYIMCFGNSVKYVPISDFISYLQSRYDCHRFKCTSDASFSS